MKKNYPTYRILFALLVFSIMFMGTGQTAIGKNDFKTIAILPFKINSSQNLDYIRNGMTRMLDSRLTWQKKVGVVPKKVIKKHLSEIESVSRSKQLGEVAKLTHCDFILVGSITHIGGAFSIDFMVYDIEKKRQVSFYEQSETISGLIGKTDRIAAMINKMVFERKTVSWEKMEKEKQAYINEQKRRNPEYMMQTPQWQETKQSPVWKIWDHLF